MHVTKNEKVVSYNYLNNPIRFKINGCVMINATNMAKPFNKLPKDFLKTKSAKRFLTAFSVRTKILTTDFVRLVQGGNAQLQGTWMHEDVALEFARWLSPEFAIWCNDRVKEILLGKGQTIESLPEKRNAANGVAFWKERAEYWSKESEWWAKQAIADCGRTLRLAEKLASVLRKA